MIRPILINGKFVKAQSNSAIDVHNPATLAPLDSVPACGEADVNVCPPPTSGRVTCLARLRIDAAARASRPRGLGGKAAPATLGDGGVYSCLEDLAKWDEALRTNALLSKAEMTPALTPVRLADGSEPLWPPGEQGGDNLFPGRPVAYGFGWFLDPWQGRPRAWHHGETMGFRSIVERFPADGVSVVVLANRGDLDLKSLALQIADAELGGAPRGAAPQVGFELK